MSTAEVVFYIWLGGTIVNFLMVVALFPIFYDRAKKRPIFTVIGTIIYSLFWFIWLPRAVYTVVRELLFKEEVE